MTLYELLHSISPDVLLKCIRQINANNDVVFSLEATYLTSVLNSLTEGDDGVPIHVIRDRYFKPIVAFDISLDSEITLSKILGRQVMVSEHLKLLPPGMLAANCYCALPVSIVVNPDCNCKVSKVFDQDTKSIVSKVSDNILLY